MKRDKRFFLLSLAMKAGGIESGEFAAGQAVKGGRAYLGVVAQDASANTKKRFINRCAYYHVPYIVFADKEQLGHCIGKEERSVLAVTNESLAGAIKEQTGRNVVDGENESF